MPVLSYIHQLFNAEQCLTYIHTLRWKDRPLQCPRCQSQDVDPWGTYHDRPRCKRHWCNGCQRTFNVDGNLSCQNGPLGQNAISCQIGSHNTLEP